MHIFTKLTALIMITLPLVFGAQTVLANEKTNHPNHEMIMLSVDINSISESELGILFKLFITLNLKFRKTLKFDQISE